MLQRLCQSLPQLKTLDLRATRTDEAGAELAKAANPSVKVLVEPALIKTGAEGGNNGLPEDDFDPDNVILLQLQPPEHD